MQKSYFPIFKFFIHFHLVFFLLPFYMLLDWAEAGTTPITVTIDHDDGGKTGARHSRNLFTALNENGCSVIDNKDTGYGFGELIFDSRPVPLVKNDRPDYRLIAQAKTLDGKLSVRGAILVHASTGIEDLSSLQGMRIAFVSKKSWSGYHMPLQLLFESGVKEQRDMFFYVGNHVGTVSMLLHSDVFATVTAEPLAMRWAEANELSIVDVTEEVETGGWWAHQSLSDHEIYKCSQALANLNRSQFKALPAWIGGFEIK